MVVCGCARVLLFMSFIAWCWRACFYLCLLLRGAGRRVFICVAYCVVLAGVLLFVSLIAWCWRACFYLCRLLRSAGRRVFICVAYCVVLVLSQLVFASKVLNLRCWRCPNKHANYSRVLFSRGNRQAVE